MDQDGPGDPSLNYDGREDPPTFFVSRSQEFAMG